MRQEVRNSGLIKLAGVGNKVINFLLEMVENEMTKDKMIENE